MRSWRLVFATIILSGTVSYAQVTAYSALRTLGSSRGEKVLSQILSISGEGTNAQPSQWKICVDDPAARGGVRELEISGNQIVSERTPAKSEWVGAKDMDLAQLNLDSDSAYRLATQEAQKKGVEFATVQFQLAIDPDSGKPGWTLQLSDSKNQRLGGVKINADSGTLVSTTWGQGAPNVLAQRKAAENSDERFLNSPESQPIPTAKAVPNENQNKRYAETQQEPVQQEANESQEGSDSLGNRTRHYTEGAENLGRTVLNRVERPFLRAGGWIQKKFTGQDTISPQSENKSEGDDDDNDSHDQYNKPVHPVPSNQ